MSDPNNLIARIGDKHGRKRNNFSSTNQPATKGRKKTRDIIKLMKAMGNSLAPADLRETPAVAQFLEANHLKGTVNEVLMARLYGLALYAGDIKAIKLILDTLNGKHAGKQSHGGVVINFVAPPVQEAPIELESDSWSSVQAPGESKAD